MNYNMNYIQTFFIRTLSLLILSVTITIPQHNPVPIVVPVLNLEEQCPADMTQPGSAIATDTMRILSLGGQSGINYFKTGDGMHLRYAHFSPSTTNVPRGAILFLQGRGTFIEYYYEAIKQLLDRGFEVWMFDLVGQGGSTRLHKEKPLHQHIDTFDTYIRHTHEFITQEISPKIAKRPLFLMGYSTGGNIALRYLEEYPTSTAGAILISPLTGLNPHLPFNITSQKILKGLLKGLSFVKGKQKGGGDVDPIFTCTQENNAYTNDPEGFKEIYALSSNNPNLSVGTPTYGWLLSAVESAATLKKPERLQSITQPVLFVSAGNDQIVLPSIDTALCKAIKNCKHTVIENAQHEILREKPAMRQQFWSDFDTFVDQYAPK